MDESLKNCMPEMLTGAALDEAMRIVPVYDAEVMRAAEAERLVALEDFYNVYIPTSMGREVYAKLYLALLRSMKKKLSMAAIRQFGENRNRIRGKEFTSIIGGSDSFTIIGDSGIGKSATVSRVIDMISSDRVIDLPNNMRIIPCVQVQTPADCSVKGLLFEILRKVDEILDTRYYSNATQSGSTADMLIGSVSTVALNHLGLLVVDEIQNIVNNKNGSTVVGMLTQLINNAGISICMVGTPKSALFFGQEMMLARRSLGLSYGPFSYDETFEGFCRELFQYQYVQNRTKLDEGVLQWLYNHSGGNASVVVSLLHDAQEISIMDGYERLDISSLEKAYKQRLAMLHDYLYQEPVQGKKPTKSRSAASVDSRVQGGSLPDGTSADRNLMEETFITDIVARAKRLQKDVAAELVFHGVEMVEVSA